MSFLLFGLTGGIASGKSTVAARFRANGLPVIDADVLARDVVAKGTPGLAAVVEVLGPDVLLPDGALDRAKVASVIFADPDRRMAINNVLHPRIAALSTERASALRDAGHVLACYEAALLVENGLSDAFRPLVVVQAPEALQLERAMKRAGWTYAQALARARAQKPLAEKIAAADYVIDNGGSLACTERQADEVLAAIRRLARTASASESPSSGSSWRLWRKASFPPTPHGVQACDYMTELALLCAIGVLGLAFAVGLARWLLGCAPGDGEMARVANLVRAASEGFFRKQSSTIVAVSAVLAGAIFLAYGLLRDAGVVEPVSALELGIWLTVSFVLGTVGSVASGHIVLWTTVRTSIRAAAGVRRSTDRALQICLRGGAISGVCITSMGLLGTGALFAATFAIKGGFSSNPSDALRLAPRIPFMLAGLALGASFAALLARIGSGVFAKSADLGADLAGLEFGLGEDDRKNPAVIADLAGDVLCGGSARGSALFEATVAETLAAMLIGGIAYRDNPRLPSVLALLLFPLVTRAFGVVAAMFGVMVVRTDDREDPRSALSRGLYVTWLLHAVGFAGASKWLLGSSWLLFFVCGVIGMAAGGGMLLISQYYTEPHFRPVRELAEAARAGPTFAILHGIGASLDSALCSVGVVGMCGIAAFRLGAESGLAHGGLLGISIATMGMLGPAAYVLAMDAFGPIADNAAGIIETSLGPDRLDVRGRTAFLDAVGNTVKTFTSAWSNGAAGLSSLLLVAAYLDESWRRLSLAETGGAVGGVPLAVRAATLGIARPVHSVPLNRPEMAFAVIVGIAIVLWLASRAVVGAARGARRMLDEVGRQLRDGPPELVPDHEACLELISGVALRHMIAPAVVAAASPLAVGVVLRFALSGDNPPHVADSVAVMVMAGTIAGVLGSFLLGNAGGTWDNAKKYIATGAHGGRHIVDDSGTRVDNPTYGAAVVGDSVGDPLKDVAGPAIHVLAKMLPVVAIVLLPFFV